MVYLGLYTSFIGGMISGRWEPTTPLNPTGIRFKTHYIRDFKWKTADCS